MTHQTQPRERRPQSLALQSILAKRGNPPLKLELIGQCVAKAAIDSQARFELPLRNDLLLPMARIPTPDDILILLDAFEKRGGVLEFAFYKFDSDADSLEAHREAARQFLDEHATACWEHRDSILKGIPYARLMEQSPYLWNEAKLKGERISRESFWGTDDLDAIVSIDPYVDGYKSAFFLPPHRLDGSVTGNLLLFELINDHILGNHDENWNSIWSWSTDCSSYFDDGHEWWGAHLWTVEVPHREMFVLIAASATD